MPDLGILQLTGAQPAKPSRFTPISTQTWFSGLVTQRSPFSSLDNRYNRRFLGGRPDSLSNGLNTEISNYATIIRRPGCSLWSNQAVTAPILSFYSFHQFGTPGSSGNINVMVDTQTEIYTVSPTTSLGLFTKSQGSGQTYFQEVGNTLYMGDGVDQLAWDGISSTTRNWGISSSGSATAMRAATTGADAGGGSPWTNPGNVTSAVSYATNAARNTNGLNATNFGFTLASSANIGGISISMTVGTIGGVAGRVHQLTAVLLKAGVPVGVPKNISVLSSAAPATYTFGGSADLWGASWLYSDINSSTWGVQISCSSLPISGSPTWEINNVKAGIYSGGAPVITPTGSGSLSTSAGGWKYVYSYGSSASGQISSPSPVGSTNGNVGGVIASYTVAASGSEYAAGDTGIFSAGNQDATYTVGTVDTSGAILTFTLTTPGSGYMVANSVPTGTAGAQPGVGVGFALNITAVTGVAYVGVGVVASSDPQVNQIWIFRTDDGGAIFYALPQMPLSNTTVTFQDTNLDSALNIELQAPAVSTNNPPPTGLVKLTYHLERIWGVIGNLVYYAAGPDTLTGNGNESFPPLNYFEFPNQVNRLVPISVGLLVFTTDDTWLIAGTNTATFYTVPYYPGLGILSYNAIDYYAGNFYMYTADRRFLQMTSAGYDEIGFPIGSPSPTSSQSLQTNFDPAKVYVAFLNSGSQDQAVFISDGASNWYRCNPSQMPEGSPAWSPLATISGSLPSCTALTSVETAPGMHQLLMGTASGEILFRDFTSFTDYFGAYEAYATLGSLVFVEPGQLALIESLTIEQTAVGSIIQPSVLIEEISGSFEALPVYTNDPPGLVPSTSVQSNRWYLNQGQVPVECRHMQIKLDFGNTSTVQQEILTTSVYGALSLKD